jgi:hypothetical protein
MNPVSEQNKTVSRRKFLKFTTLLSFSGLIQFFYSVKARAGGFIAFAFMKKQPPIAVSYVDNVFSTFLYTGNAASQTITNGINFTGNGGVLWLKGRDAVSSNTIFDTLTGAGYRHQTNGNSADISSSFTGFNSNGFTLSSVQSGELTNANGASYVSWSFRKAARFFDFYSVLKSAGTNATVNFANLGTIGMVLVKRTDSSGSWYVWHRSLSSGKLIYLDQTVPEATLGNITVIGSSVTLVNGVIADGSYIVYGFAHDAASDGIIQCGIYTGNGSAQSINVGWEPQYLIYKSANNTDNWIAVDSMRGWTRSASLTNNLYPNLTNVESTGNYLGYGPEATGFSVPSGLSTNGINYFYLAIRRSNKPPTSGTQVFNAIQTSGNGATMTITNVGFAPDLFINKDKSGNDYLWFDRLRGIGNYIKSNDIVAEANLSTTVTSFNMDGISYGNAGGNTSGKNFINYFFKRAAGFLDIICYTGNGAAGQIIDHQLGVSPELILLKQRNGSWDWRVYASSQGNASVAYLNGNSPYGGSSGWNNQTPSSTQIFLNGYNTNAATYVAYLFATLQGISKVGSYTGSASGAVVVSCGFSGSARFVLIKRTDAAGDWILIDSIRGNNYYLILNTPTAEVSGTLLNFTTGGFTTASSGSISNISGATYIFLAIS